MNEIVALEKLAAEIRAEHRKATASAINALEHAIIAGRLLAQAKAAVAHGEWLPWLAANCPEVSERTAQVYMRVSKTAPALLEDKSAAAAHLTLRGALALTTTHREVESVLPELTVDDYHCAISKVLHEPTVDDVDRAMREAFMRAGYVLWVREERLESGHGIDETFERDYVDPALAELNALFQTWLVSHGEPAATQNEERES